MVQQRAWCGCGRGRSAAGKAQGGSSEGQRQRRTRGGEGGQLPGLVLGVSSRTQGFRAAVVLVQVLVRVLARRVSCRARSPTAHDGGPPARRAANALPCTAGRGPARLPVVPGCNARHHWVWRQRSSQRSTGWHLELAPGRRPSTHGAGSRRTRQRQPPPHRNASQRPPAACEPSHAMAFCDR